MTVPEYELSKDSICREKRQSRKLRKVHSVPNKLGHLKYIIKPSNGASLELILEEQDSNNESEKEGSSEPDSVFSSAWSHHVGDRQEV